MITAIILAGGTGSRMKTNGLPKQFLSLYGKPIICYTLETFNNCPDVDRIVVPCNADWVDHMKHLVESYGYNKVVAVVPGGADRHGSVRKGMACLEDVADDDIIIIHDGVRPMVSKETICENVRVAKEFGDAMTVRPCIETAVISEDGTAVDGDFTNRDKTYMLTSPQTFKTKTLIDMYREMDNLNDGKVPLLDASMMYAKLGHQVHLVKEDSLNIKVTTPLDFYYLRSYLEMQESQNIFGI